ncbi:hypothetical protein GQ85_19830 [Rhodococcus rhodochrous]|nr:hypothetical protein GQ85_19830 [Rhodococcus rhodochrous]
MNDTLPQPADVYSDDGTFVIIPDYVLNAPISANAFRLYAVLRSYADNRTGQAHPSRRTLATRMHMKDPRVVDRAVAELAAAGLCAVFPRYRDTEGRVSLTRSAEFCNHTSNGYRLLRPVAAGPRGGGVVPENAPPDASPGTGGGCLKTHHPVPQNAPPWCLKTHRN